jgi:hypothetical protein
MTAIREEHVIAVAYEGQNRGIPMARVRVTFEGGEFVLVDVPSDWKPDPLDAFTKAVREAVVLINVRLAMQQQFELLRSQRFAQVSARCRHERS